MAVNIVLTTFALRTVMIQVAFSLCMEFLPAKGRGFWLVFLEAFWTVSVFVIEFSMHILSADDEIES